MANYSEFFSFLDHSALFSSPFPPPSTQQSQHLYPPLGDQIPLRQAGQSGAELTQDDLDRIWKPIFEDYNGGEGCCEGCTTRKLRIPLKNLKDLLAALPTADVEAQQQQQQQDIDDSQFQHLSRRNRQRATQIQRQQGQIPMPRWVLELVTKKADKDEDGWVEYEEFCAIILEHKQDLTSTHLTGLEKVSRIHWLHLIWLAGEVCWGRGSPGLPVEKLVIEIDHQAR